MPDDSTEIMRNLSAVEEAEHRAFVRGTETALVKSRLDEHDRRLKAINGSIERSARAQEKTAERLDDLVASVEKSTAIAQTRADVADELALTAAKTNVDRRTFLVSLVVASAGIAGVVVAALAIFLH